MNPATAYSKVTCNHQISFPLTDVFINHLWRGKSFGEYSRGDMLITPMISTKLEEEE